MISVVPEFPIFKRLEYCDVFIVNESVFDFRTLFNIWNKMYHNISMSCNFCSSLIVKWILTQTLCDYDDKYLLGIYYVKALPYVLHIY